MINHVNSWAGGWKLYWWFCYSWALEKVTKTVPCI